MLEAVNETWLVNVASAAIVKLNPDVVHLLHGFEWDGGGRAGASRGGTDGVFVGGVRIHEFAEGREEGGVVAWLVVLIV